MISGGDTTVYYSTNGKDVLSKEISKVYFRKNPDNNDAFSIIKIVEYDRNRNRFYNPFALNRYLTHTVLVLPKAEFDMIPKSFIRPEIFFK
jgi:transposase